MDKNIISDNKSNQLAELLSDNIENNGAKINMARIKLMSMVIIALVQGTDLSFYKLTLAFDSTSTADSSLRRCSASLPALVCTTI